MVSIHPPPADRLLANPISVPMADLSMRVIAKPCVVNPNAALQNPTVFRVYPESFRIANVLLLPLSPGPLRLAVMEFLEYLHSVAGKVAGRKIR